MKQFDADSPDDHRKIASWLGYAGLLPFVCSSLLILVGHGAVRQIAIEGLVNYAAIIVSFMAAIHWGRAMFDVAGPENQTKSPVNRKLLYAFSVVPAVLGWLCLFFDSALSMFFFAIIFAGLYLFDRQTLIGRSTSAWYLALRARLTIVVIATLCLSAIAL